MAQRGEADSYYTGGGPPQQPQDAYQGQKDYGQQGQYSNGQQQQYYGQQQQPPQYGQNFAHSQGPPPPQQGYGQQGHGDNKQSFEQTFKIGKPKYNDLWAGILLILVFLGYVAVSVISIRGYCEYSLCCSVAGRAMVLMF